MSGAMSAQPDPEPSADRRLAWLVGALPDAVVLLRGDGTVHWANHAAERMFDRRFEAAGTISAIDLVHPQDLEFALVSLESVQDKEVGTPMPWPEEGSVLLSVRDVTDRRRFEVANDEVARFRSLVHNAASVTMLVSADGTVESVSGALTRILGHDPELVEGRPITDMVAPAHRHRVVAAVGRASQGAPAAAPLLVAVDMVRHGTAETIPFELSIVNLLDDPTVRGYVVSAHDVRARAAVELELRSTLSLLTATLDSTADGILVVDCEGRITSSNGRFAQMWHIPDAVLHAGDDTVALEFVLDQLVRPDAFVAKVAELYAQPDAESDDILEFKDGRVFERHSKPQRVDGEVVGRVWSFSDITDRKVLEAELSYQAFHDSLTGLANKALFQDRLAHALARLERTKGHLAVLFVDLDNFKTVNDSLGHGAGDELLTTVSKRLVHCLRGADTAARLGGDEFAVLIEDVERAADAVVLAERFLEEVRRPMVVASTEVSSTASIGIAFDSPAITADQLLRNADLAMYRAKELGKDRFERFETEMHTAAVARLETEADLRRAVAAGEIVVHYQPIIDLDDDAIVGFEALARWEHPRRGLLEPGAFIPVAEEIGLVELIDHSVLAQACAQTRLWQRAHRRPVPLMVSANLSARRLVRDDLPEDVGLVLAQSGLDPQSLILEITESAMTRDVDTAVRNLRALKASGIRIALDDFGTGYSPLTNLGRLPIDIVKIDRSFVVSAVPGATESGDPPIGDLAAAIIQLARTLGHTPIAEGVERAEHARHLSALGCRLAQGYHLGRPLDALATGSVLERADAPFARGPLSALR